MTELLPQPPPLPPARKIFGGKSQASFPLARFRKAFLSRLINQIYPQIGPIRDPSRWARQSVGAFAWDADLVMDCLDLWKWFCTNLGETAWFASCLPLKCYSARCTSHATKCQDETRARLIGQNERSWMIIGVRLLLSIARWTVEYSGARISQILTGYYGLGSLAGTDCGLAARTSAQWTCKQMPVPLPRLHRQENVMTRKFRPVGSC
jgi:hypothetical protein